MRFFAIVFVIVAVAALIASRTVGVRPLPPQSSLPTFNETRAKLGAGPVSIQPPPPWQSDEVIAGCTPPGLSDDVLLVLVSAHGADGLSSTALRSQEDSVTAGTLQIEEGDKPLYIVAVTFEPVIWQVTGAVGRVRHLVLASEAYVRPVKGLMAKPDGPAMAGATGLPRDRVTVMSDRRCLRNFTKVPSVDASLTAGVLKRHLIRMPDVMVADEYVAGFSLPSGAVRHGRPGFFSWSVVPALALQTLGLKFELPVGRALLAHEMGRFHPSGVVEIDSASVISRYPPMPYNVLPQEAGLLQLIDRGDVAADHLGHLTVLKPIRLPAGLYGGHRQIFKLAEGVPVPTGDVGHSCVVSQVTGKLVLGADFSC